MQTCKGTNPRNFYSTLGFCGFVGLVDPLALILESRFIAYLPCFMVVLVGFLHVIPSCRRFLLPEYLPYAGIFHERGQPGLATHSSVNRVLAGKEMFFWILKMWRGREPGKAFPSITCVDMMASWQLAENSVLKSCTQFLTSRQETAGLKKALSLAHSHFLPTSLKKHFWGILFCLKHLSPNPAIRFWLCF